MDEFSFMLRPSPHGVGVFAIHSIAAGEPLRLFAEEEGIDLDLLERTATDVPPAFRKLCIFRGAKMVCPLDFGHIPIGWYMNHSFTPNAVRDGSYRWYAARDIAPGEEILIDYNCLDEPEEEKEDFYKLQKVSCNGHE